MNAHLSLHRYELEIEYVDESGTPITLHPVIRIDALTGEGQQEQSPF